MALISSSPICPTLSPILSSRRPSANLALFAAVFFSLRKARQSITDLLWFIYIFSCEFHSADSEDAERAIEMKNGTAVGAQNVVVEHANPRASLQQRRAKSNHVKPSTSRKGKGLWVDLVDVENHSGKQRVARTVIVGGLLNASMAEDALSCAKEIDGVCSVKYPLAKEVLELNGLTHDGCEPDAAAVLYASVRSARAAVAKLHRKEIKGHYIWARQLGGEGSKTQKWKLIIHNLPFKATGDELREKFSSAGFVWDVTIPRNPETGVSKGFAFVKFTSKQDAERAIQKFDGKKFFTRTIAADWAISKKLYGSCANSAVVTEEGKHAESAADSGSDGSDTAPDVSELVENKTIQTAVADDLKEEAEIAQKVLQNLITRSNKVTSSSDSQSSLPPKDPNAGPGPGTVLPMTVFKAVEKSKTEQTDRRNLYLAKEGLILEGTPAAEGVSSSDMEKRQGLQRMKMVKLRSPNFHVSRTRLIIYNLPKSMNAKDLKRTFICAITSRAVKQNPKIHLITVLKNTKIKKVVSKNYSRGVAFVEFTEHEHALVALRVLNNNPETFGPEHRPIVEFAVDNIQTLRRRNMKIAGEQEKYKLSGSLKKKNKRKATDEAYDGDYDRGTIKKMKINQEIKKLNPIKDQAQKKENKQQEPKSLKKSNKRKVRDMGDKLDVLIQQYLSKFAQRDSDTGDGDPRQIRRWFQ